MLFGIKDSSNVTVQSNATKKQVLYANYANKTDISFSASPIYALKKGVKSISWDSQREGTLAMSMQVFDLKWIALLMGTEFKAGTSADRISERKVLEIANATASFTGEFVAGSMNVFALDEDGITQTTEFESTSSTPAAGQYKVVTTGTGATATSTLTFASGTTGKVVVYVLKAAAATNKKFVVEVDKYPSGYTLFMDTTIKGNDGVEEMVQIMLPNVKPQSNMTLTFDAENVCTLDITWDILADTNNEMLHFTTL